MKILLPIDDSKYSQQAVRALLTQVNQRGTRVRVLHVVEPITVYFTSGLVPQLVAEVAAAEADRKKQAKALVLRTVAKLRQGGFQAGGVVETGDPKSKIVDHAAQWRADLIIVGSHGLRGLGRFLMGSVSEAVMRHAGCSVQVVRVRGGARRATRKRSQ